MICGRIGDSHLGLDVRATGSYLVMSEGYTERLRLTEEEAREAIKVIRMAFQANGWQENVE